MPSGDGDGDLQGVSPLAPGMTADMGRRQPGDVGMRRLRADDDLHHQEPGNLFLVFHLREAFQQFLVMPRVQVQQVRMQPVFAVIVFDKSV